MDPARLRKLLAGVRRGRITTSQALEAIARLPFESIGAGTVDHHRGIRQSLPEVILCQGKTKTQCVSIARSIVSRSGRLLATRASAEQARALVEEFQDAATWNEAARTVTVHAGGTRRNGSAAGGRPGAPRDGSPETCWS